MEKDLLYRYVEGRVSDEEIAEVVAWLDQDEANVREYMVLHNLYNITIMNEAVAEKCFNKEKKRINFRMISLELIKIAAIALIVFGATHFFPTKTCDVERPVIWQTLHIPAGQRAELTLCDSTKVWLNAQSTLVFPNYFSKDRREVKLDGEAFFHVHSDSKHPFIVNTSKMNVVVTGTEFNVFSYLSSDVFSVALLRGQVSLQTPDAKQLYQMKPNDYVEFSGNSLNVSDIQDHNYFRWREGLFCFTNETVGSIMKRLELYYDVTIEIDRRDLLQYRYTGKFRAKDGIEQVLKILQMEHHFTYKRDNEKNCITIK